MSIANPGKSNILGMSIKKSVFSMSKLSNEQESGSALEKLFDL